MSLIDMLFYFRLRPSDVLKNSPQISKIRLSPRLLKRILKQLPILLASLYLGSALASTYPDKPIHVITPFPAGGAADVVLRLVTQSLSTQLATPVVVENKAGAGGGIGTQFVTRAEPDGYTLLLTSSSPVSINPLFLDKPLYNPLTDLTPISLIGASPNVLVVSANSPINNLTQFIEYAKAHQGQFTFASNGAGTVSHLSGELFNQYTGLKGLHIPYKGAAPAVADTIGGQVTALFAAVGSVNAMVKGGKLKMIAITSTHRLALSPETPTLSEMGLKGFESNQWWGLFGPVGLPDPIVEKLNSQMNKLLGSPEVKQRFAQEAIELMGGSAADLAKYLREDYNKWERVVKAAHLKAQIQ
jgi:tripartite-type tricarboxylate transporter receptor subunit TctC